MSTLTWSDSLTLNQPQMDQTHREFVDLLADVEAALGSPHDTIAERFAELLAHTEQHFAQEEQWMQRIGFAPENCHAFQHKQVLDVLREVGRRIGTEGDQEILSNLVAELSKWFPVHAQMMDQALAETMAMVGLDPATGQMSRPPEAPREPVTGCGSASCS
jgi:hemerythrin-like metal-binding protein